MQGIPGARWLARLAESVIWTHVRNPAPTYKVESDWQGCLMSHISTHVNIHTYTHAFILHMHNKREMEPGKTSEKWSSHQRSANHTSMGGYSHGLLSELSCLKSQLGTCVCSAYHVTHNSELGVPTSEQGVTHVFPHPLTFQSPEL